MNRDDFDASMTYWQTLRIVARGLIQPPVRTGEWDEFNEAATTAICYASAPFIRLIAMVLLPISAPLFAWCVQVDRRKTAAAMDAAKHDFEASRSKLVRTAKDDTPAAG